MRKTRLEAWILVFGLMLTGIASGDVLITRDGQTIETKGTWEVKGRQVIFTTIDEKLASIRTSEVDLEASTKATEKALDEEAGGPEEAESEEAIQRDESSLASKVQDKSRGKQGKAVLTLTDENLPSESAGGAAGNGSDMAAQLVGTWVGSLDFFDTTYELMSDGTYVTTGEIMGIQMISKGSWRVENGALVLDQTESIEAGEPMQAERTMVQRITKMTAEELEMEHENALDKTVKTVLKRR